MFAQCSGGMSQSFSFARVHTNTYHSPFFWCEYLCIFLVCKNDIYILFFGKDGNNV